MNWGKWIVLSFVLFALFIGTLVTVCVRQDVSLVAPDYYKQEINYQQQMERNQNAVDLPVKPEISVNKNVLQVSFEGTKSIDGGELILFRSSNSSLDQKFNLKSGDTLQQFDISAQPIGSYKARMNWTMDGKEYFIEEPIYLN